MSYTAVIPAAGLGRRMDIDMNKVFIEIGGRPIIEMTVAEFQQDDRCDAIYLAARHEEVGYLRTMLEDYDKVRGVVAGGDERQDSIYNVLKEIPSCDYVFIHDGARPFISQEMLERVYDKVKASRAVICGVRAKDTIKEIDGDRIVRTVPRKSLFIVHTPQAFEYDLIMTAYKNAAEKNLDVTDDAGMVEALGADVHITESNYDNIKVTTREDLEVATAIIGRKREQ